MIWLRFMGGVSQWPRVAASCVEASALFTIQKKLYTFGDPNLLRNSLHAFFFRTVVSDSAG